jgi:chemotaxis protein CheY-P-specific phosphatase CheC
MEGMRMVWKVSGLEKDFVKEISSIGSGNASTFLSKEIGAEVKLVAPKYDLISLDQFEKCVKMPEGVAVCVFAKFEAETFGAVILTFDQRSAFAMADLLQKKKTGTTRWLSEEDQSRLKHFGHLLLKCYLDAISPFITNEIKESEMKIFSTIGEAVIDIITLGARKSDMFIVLQNDFVTKTPRHLEGKYAYALRTDKRHLQMLYKRATMKSRSRVAKQRNRKKLT